MIINANTDSLTITTSWTRSESQMIDRISAYPVALIADTQQRMNVAHSSIRLLTHGLSMSGNVLPVTTREGDNLAIHRALDFAHEGDVLVINALGETSRACFGGILGELCLAKKVAGVVIDGATRDVEELRQMGLPVFAKAVSPAGPFKTGPGSIGIPTSCGNVVCHAGDAIFGDSDGIVVVPQQQVPHILALVQAQDQLETDIRSRILADTTSASTDRNFTDSRE